MDDKTLRKKYPPGTPVRAMRELERLGISDLRELTLQTLKDLLIAPNVGRKSVEKLASLAGVEMKPVKKTVNLSRDRLSVLLGRHGVAPDIAETIAADLFG